ncbi:MAG: hypothetical protein OEM81_11535 [Acidimicrobiia bacterium]|nr:hypothetical protein [Acidimicrobiia bacterium]MDH3398445.1 hypothetical protein [Acidimicrobiia bacterium]
MDLLRNIGEIGLGALFLIGAVFNATYTRTHGEKFYGSFADGAWLGPARQMIEKVVIPNATVFTMALVLFQATVAIMILLRGDLLQCALLAGGGFALVAAGASSPGGTIANLALAAVQFTLALT